jgi:26S proteasome regulatory subunit N9
MSFQQVAEATRVPVHEVEHLIMKALSLKLIRGSVDQIDSTVDITWVQPRVLDAQQLGMLAGQFGEWTRAVGKTEGKVGALRQSAQKAVAVA